MYRAIAEDGDSLISEVEPTELNEQKLWHTHFIDADSYWVTVDLDWGLCYREFFRRIAGKLNDEQLEAYAMLGI